MQVSIEVEGYLKATRTGSAILYFFFGWKVRTNLQVQEEEPDDTFRPETTSRAPARPQSIMVPSEGDKTYLITHFSPVRQHLVCEGL